MSDDPINPTVVQLRPPSELAGYLRLGFTGYRKLADLHAAGRLHFRRFVVEAAYFIEHWDLIRDLQADGCEIVLDTNFAELASPGKFAGASLRKLPWAKNDRPWTVSDFALGANFNAARAIAEFAAAADVAAVLAPTHLHEPGDASWQRIDAELCLALRRELDRAGVQDIAIDYQWITSAGVLKDEKARREQLAIVADLPVENLWVRAAGFGSKATGAGARHHLRCLAALHGGGLPLIADMTGGFPGLAVLAFGAGAGLAHGIGVKENFNLANWRKPLLGAGSGGTRIYIAELDRYFSERQLETLLAARGARSRVACIDRTCCPHGGDDMIESSEAHFLKQRAGQIANLAAVPDHRRASHFIEQHLDPAVSIARQIDRCEMADDALAGAIGEAKVRLVRLRDAMVQHCEEGSVTSLSPAPRFRGSTIRPGAILRQ